MLKQNSQELPYYDLEKSQQTELDLVVKESRDARRQLTNTLQSFAEYAKRNGSRGYQWYYSSCTRMIYSLLGFAKDTRKENLNPNQLSKLLMAEEVVSRALSHSVKWKMPYKECFRYAKNQLKIYLKKSELASQQKSPL